MASMSVDAASSMESIPTRPALYKASSSASIASTRSVVRSGAYWNNLISIMGGVYGDTPQATVHESTRKTKTTLVPVTEDGAELVKVETRSSEKSSRSIKVPSSATRSSSAKPSVFRRFTKRGSATVQPVLPDLAVNPLPKQNLISVEKDGVTFWVPEYLLSRTDAQNPIIPSAATFQELDATSTPVHNEESDIATQLPKIEASTPSPVPHLEPTYDVGPRVSSLNRKPLAIQTSNTIHPVRSTIQMSAVDDSPTIHRSPHNSASYSSAESSPLRSVGSQSSGRSSQSSFDITTPLETKRVVQPWIQDDYSFPDPLKDHIDDIYQEVPDTLGLDLFPLPGSSRPSSRVHTPPESIKQSKKESSVKTKTHLPLASTTNTETLTLAPPPRSNKRASNRISSPPSDLAPNIVDKVSTDAPRPIAAEAADYIVFSILCRVRSFEDLASSARVNHGFYSVYKRYELALLKDVLYNTSPAAWEFRESSRTQVTANLSPGIYLRYYLRDQCTLNSLKSVINVRCDSLLRPETLAGLRSKGSPRSREIDNALWRIATFCNIFGSGRGREEDLTSQIEWLSGGVAIRKIPSSGKSVTFGRGNAGGLSAAELYDMTELWGCLQFLLSGINGVERMDQARAHGIFAGHSGAELVGEENVLEEWVNFLLTLGLSTVLDLATPAKSSSDAVFSTARDMGLTAWQMAPGHGSRRSFLKEAVGRMYEARILVHPSQKQHMEEETAPVLEPPERKSATSSAYSTRPNTPLPLAPPARSTARSSRIPIAV